jgi:hypothetical protein
MPSRTVQASNDWTYHRLVNTTPKPRATKKSRGELVALPVLFPLLLVVVAVAAAVVVVDAILG